MRKMWWLSVAMVVAPLLMHGQATEKVLFSFGGYQDDGTGPNSTLVSDGAGNLYGTTVTGGAYGGGTIFKLSPYSDGSWTESILYSFCYFNDYGNCPGGGFSSGLTIDTAGNLYGVATYGGLPCSYQMGSGCGVAFELSPPNANVGSWTYAVIYDFCSAGQFCDDGAAPDGTLIIDESGNLYGTTFKGGKNQVNADYGVVFELTPSSGAWTESVLYNFCSVQQGTFCLDGADPLGVTRDKEGNLYGFTGFGGNAGTNGVLYKISQGSNGWMETVLRQLDFNFRDEVYLGPISIDSKGNLYTTYTTTRDRERYTNGFVGKLAANGTVSKFEFDGTDGRAPEYGVLLDPRHGLLFGTTIGSDRGPGNAFEIDELGDETVLYDFCQQAACADGSVPGGGLLEDRTGNLFGVTVIGGEHDSGTVFEITR